MTRLEAAQILREYLGLPQVDKVDTTPDGSNLKVKEAIVEGIVALEEAAKFLIAKKEVKVTPPKIAPPVVK